MSLKIILPIPPACLSPNARPHWRKKAAAIKMVRNHACIAARCKISGAPKLHEAHVHIRWFTKTTKRPDGDNALSQLKGVFDGVTDSGYLSDDRGLTFHPITFAKDAGNPRVEITFEPEAQP